MVAGDNSPPSLAHSTTYTKTHRSTDPPTPYVVHSVRACAHHAPLTPLRRSLALISDTLTPRSLTALTALTAYRPCLPRLLFPSSPGPFGSSHTPCTFALAGWLMAPSAIPFPSYTLLSKPVFHPHTPPHTTSHRR